MALELPDTNLGAVNDHKLVLEEATPEDREQRQNHSQKPVAKRSRPKRQRQIAEKEHRGEELARRRAEDLPEVHSDEESDKDVSKRQRAQPTAGRQRA